MLISVPGARSTGVRASRACFGVAQPFGGVVRLQLDPVRAGLGPDHVPGVAGRGERDGGADAGGRPHPGGLHRGAGLTGAGRADHDLGAAGRGEQEVRGSGLVHAEPGAGGLAHRGRRGRLPGLEVRLEPGAVRAEQPRRLAGVQARRAGLLSLRQQLLLQGELSVGGVPLRSVRAEHALAVAAAQAVRDARPLRSREQRDLLPRAAADRVTGQGFQRGAAGHRVGRERLADVADQVGLGPGGHLRLGGRDGLGHHPAGLVLGEPARLAAGGAAPGGAGVGADADILFLFQRPILRPLLSLVCGALRSGQCLRPARVAPDLVPGLRLALLLSFPGSEQQSRIGCAGFGGSGVGAAAGHEAGEPFDPRVLVPAGGAAALAGELPGDAPRHPAHRLGNCRGWIGSFRISHFGAAIAGAEAGLAGGLSDGARDRGELDQVVLAGGGFPLAELGAQVEGLARLGLAGPQRNVAEDQEHLPLVRLPAVLAFPLAGDLPGALGDVLAAG